LNEFKIFALR